MFQIMARGKIDEIQYRPGTENSDETCVVVLIVNEYYEGAAHDNLYLAYFDAYQTKRIRKVDGKIKYMTVRADRIVHRVVPGGQQAASVEVWLMAREFFS